MRKRAFTLVELLVVIGIIAVLVGVLLPVLSKVQGRGRDLKCQTNIRQIMIALTGYAQENRGFYPYGFHYARAMNPWGASPDWREAAGNNNQFVSWGSQVTRWMHRGKVGNAENEIYNYGEVLKCPEAQQVWPHPLSYAMNIMVGITPFYELQRGFPPNAQLRPTNMKQLLKDTALVWDTTCLQGSEMNVGWMVGLAIDEGRYYENVGAPAFRYFLPQDPFSGTPEKYGNNDPIKLRYRADYFNIDPAFDQNTPDNNHYPYNGNVRFRHQGNKACNAGFVDGHVEAFVAKIGPRNSVVDHNALRRYFMIKPPTGVRVVPP
jgi:prepilin-type N-terminal cleavage/methylation domain-containing protein/prepilin-type processing-associated H-X9-DG protein